MTTGALGKTYEDGDVILRQGETAKEMFVIQEGEAEVLHEDGGREIRLTVLGARDFFGEVPFFHRVKDPGVARATVRSMGGVRVLTVDKKAIVKRMHEDPSLGYRILETMSRRMRELEEEIIRLAIGNEEQTDDGSPDAVQAGNGQTSE